MSLRMQAQITAIISAGTRDITVPSNDPDCSKHSVSKKVVVNNSRGVGLAATQAAVECRLRLSKKHGAARSAAAVDPLRMCNTHVLAERTDSDFSYG
jgi:hypothetical protein